MSYATMSNKLKQADHKKLLVRNTSANPSKTSIATRKSNLTKSKSETTASTRKSTLPSERTSDPKITTSFDLPDLNTALRLTDKIKAVENLKPRKTKSVPAVDDNKLCADEKMTRLINFPYDQHIYKGLIPICVKDCPQTVVSSRPPMLQKDKDPVLSDYCEPRHCREYTYTPKVRYEREQLRSIPNNNLRLYKILQLAHNDT